MPTFDDEEAVFNAALDREEGHDRAAFLDKACDGDPEFRRRIEQLLSAYSDGNCFRARDPILARVAPSLLQEKSATTVGSYALLEQIGEGGMGDVYLARRVTGDRRPVALKVIKPGMDSRQVMSRFELERTSLARMDHPNIARFIEAGVSDQGRAYFVMELVRGLPITDYCDRQHLQVRQRLKLIVDLCLAVEHAHSRGLVHRDPTTSEIYCIEFSPNGNKLALGEVHGVSLWDVPSLRPAGLYGGHVATPTNLRFSPNGRTIASIDFRSIHIWDASTALGFSTIPIWQCPVPWLTFVDDC